MRTPTVGTSFSVGMLIPNTCVLPMPTSLGWTATWAVATAGINNTAINAVTLAEIFLNIFTPFYGYLLFRLDPSHMLQA